MILLYLIMAAEKPAWDTLMWQKVEPVLDKFDSLLKRERHQFDPVVANKIRMAVKVEQDIPNGVSTKLGLERVSAALAIILENHPSIQGAQDLKKEVDKYLSIFVDTSTK